jgi:hypothetical protein
MLFAADGFAESSLMMLLAFEPGSNVQVAIADATKGNHYECMLCRGRVSAVKGDSNSHHFRHVTNKCSEYKSGETPLHVYAKEFLKTHRMLYLPDGRVQTFDKVEIESFNEAGLRIDAVGYYGRRVYLIEFAVWHKVDNKKREILRTLNFDVIEIDLSSWRKPCPTQAAPGAINGIIFQHAPRQWLQRHHAIPWFHRIFSAIRQKFNLWRAHQGKQSKDPEQLSLHLHHVKH